MQPGVALGAHPVSDHLGEWLAAELARFLPGHHHHCRRAVRDLRSVACGDRAVALERRSQLRERLRRRVRPDAFVARDRHRFAAPRRHGHCNDLFAERAILPGTMRSLMRSRRPLILILTRDLELAVHLVRALAHVLLGEGRPQAVVHHRIDHLGVAQAGAEARLRDEIRGLGHRLHAAGHDDLDLAGADELVGQGDRIEAGQAHLIDGDGRHLLRDATFDGRLTGCDLARAGLQDLAHDHVVDVFALDAGTLEGRADGVSSEGHSRHVFECPRELANRRARTR